MPVNNPETHGLIIGDEDHAANNIIAQDDLIAEEARLENNRNEEEYDMLITGTGESAVRR